MVDELQNQLQERLGSAVAKAATAGEPLFGTVEVTIGELATLLEDRAQTKVPPDVPPECIPFVKDRDRILDAVHSAIVGHDCASQRATGHSCDLADRLTDILPDRR